MTWKIIRTPTWRKELKYEVVKVDKDSEMNDAIYSHLQTHLPTYRDEDRAIIFCRNKTQVDEIAGLFNVKPFYAPGVNDEARVIQNEETMKSWLAGKNKVMVSTSLLGCGLDCAHIRDVIHRDPSYTMIDQDQEDGRGGRDGLETRATIFVVKKNSYKISQSPHNFGTQDLITSIYHETTCLRSSRSRFIDGRSVQCVSLPGAAFCGRCDRVMLETPSRPLAPVINQSVARIPFGIPTPMTARSSMIPTHTPARHTPPRLPSMSPVPSQTDDMLDVFGSSTTVDLRQRVRTEKRVRYNTTSSLFYSVSPRKRAKITHSSATEE